MTTVILDAELANELIKDRRARGADRYDEVWEGTYMMASMPNNEHQQMVNSFAAVMQSVVVWPKRGLSFPGCNVSDREVGWKDNYRVPDVAVFLNDTSAINRGTFWQGGPDFAIEIISDGDRSREKLGFYATVNTKELLVIDRDPWQMEVYRLTNGKLVLSETARQSDNGTVRSEVLGLAFAMQWRKGQESLEPLLVVSESATNQSWTI